MSKLYPYTCCCYLRHEQKNRQSDVVLWRSPINEEYRGENNIKIKYIKNNKIAEKNYKKNFQLLQFVYIVVKQKTTKGMCMNNFILLLLLLLLFLLLFALVGLELNKCLLNTAQFTHTHSENQSERLEILNKIQRVLKCTGISFKVGPTK